LVQVAEQDCPHLLFYGPPGSGKKTLIMALIKQMFGAGAEKVVSSFLHRYLEISFYFFRPWRVDFVGDIFLCLDVPLQVKMENKTWKIDVSYNLSFSPVHLCYGVMVSFANCSMSLTNCHRVVCKRSVSDVTKLAV
jgi:DNA polymerase III delta prime subunit